MAGDWIPIRINLRTDPRVVTMAALLKRSPQHIMGCLCQVWSAANEHTVDGKLKGYTLGAIDALTETKAFGGAMAAQGWLIVEADGLLCPDFDKYNSDSAKTRLQNARRAARHRNTKSVTKVTQTSRSQRDESNDDTVIKSVPTEQNRTEQKKNNSNSINKVLSAPAPVAAPTAAPAPAADAADDGLRKWAAERARRPEWLPQGKGWIRAGVWLDTARACPHVTREQFEDIIREAKASRGTLDNPAGFVLARLREIGGVA